ncbi:MAG: amidohydrolase family protein [Deltaproteobacteria bacterium]|nr:amidohydrolase family protein [Deltaproteobacteria bacterium]
MIFDIHSHIGDILYPNGGELISEIGVPRHSKKDLISYAEHKLFRLGKMDMPQGDEAAIMDIIAQGSRERVFTATLENMRASLAETDIVKSVCLPVPPHVTFDDLKRAQPEESAIVPFTGVDFGKEYDFESSLRRDVSQGARGLKIHPIIQKISLTSTPVHEVVEAFAPYKLPILLHCGVASYYLGEEKETNQIMKYGEIHYAKQLVSDFPSVSFIIGHAGLSQVSDVIGLMGNLRNIWVDVTFQSPQTIIRLLSTFGAEKVVYASDWPFGDRKTSIKAVKEACKGDSALEQLVFWENAVHLLRTPA